MRYLTTVLLFLIVFYSGVFSQTENYLRFENISVNDGLSQSTGRVVMQDSKGYIWIGTQDGLNKYDGYKFTIYNHDPLETGSLSDNFIQDIVEDQSGYLWIAYNTGGLDRFDPDLETAINYKNQAGDSISLSSDNVTDIFIDSEDRLWVGTNSGLNLFREETSTFERVRMNGLENPVPSINCIYEDLHGRFWIGTLRQGLVEFDRIKAEVVNHYRYLPDSLSLSSNNVSSVLEDSYGDFWVTTFNSGLNRLNRESGLVEIFRNDPDDPTSISSDRCDLVLETSLGAKILWIGTQGGGLNRFNRESESFTSYQNDAEDPFSISNNIVFSMTVSTDGSMWIGTGGGGINKFSLRKNKFHHYKYPGNILANFIYSIFPGENDKVWIGSQGYGMIRYDRSSNTFENYPLIPDQPELSSNIRIQSAFISENGTLWAASNGNGLFMVNEKSGIHRNYLWDVSDSTSITSNSLRVVFESSEGEIWIGFNGGGLSMFDPQLEEFTLYQNDPSDSSSLGANGVSCIFEDREGYLWIGTFGGGLNRLDRSGGQFTRYVHDPEDPASISNNRIRCVFEDNDGILWIGTDHGLNKMDKSRGEFTAFSTKHGLPNNVVYGILPDQKGNFWLSTNLGISRFNPTDTTFRNYDEEDGLQSNEFNTGGYFLSESGEMYFAGVNGFNIFHPDSIRENVFVPPVIITSIKLFNQTVKIGQDSPLKNSISETDVIVLNHRQNFVSFEFAAFNYINVEKNRYRYMLEGIDPDWVEAGNRRFADYPGLRPGKYVFRVIGSNNDNTWNMEGDRIKLIIRPPWYKSYPAWIIYILLLLLLIFTIIRLRTINLERQRKKLELQVAERTREIAQQKEEIETQRDSLEELNAAKDKLFRIIAHDLKNPMTALMSITQSLSTSYHLLDEEDRDEAIRQVERAAGDLLRLLENLLQWTTSQAGKMPYRPENFDLQSVVKENLSLAEPLARKKGISIQSDIPHGSMVHADRNMISTVFRNLISNAIKFTPERGSIKIESSLFSDDETPACHRVTVSDTGIGIPKEKIDRLFRMDTTWTTKGTADEKGTGLGLLLCHDFLTRNRGTLKVESELGKGSRFIFSLPASPRQK